MDALTGPVQWPIPPEALLKAKYVGRDLREIEGPAAVLDLAVLRKNCALMLKTVEALDVGFRAHVKTHKTREMTEMQVGPAPNTVRLIFSTVIEAEFHLPYLLECKTQGREVNIVYGIPPSSTCLERLQILRDALGPDSLSFLVDHPSQLQNLLPRDTASSTTSSPIPIFVKTDTGYHRAGLPPNNPALLEFLEAVSKAQHIRLHGFYSHNSNSYGSNNPAEAMTFLNIELSGCAAAAAVARSNFPVFADSRFTLSVGATPTATSAQNLLASASGPEPDSKAAEAVAATRKLTAELKQHHNVELHAGVYPTLDLQQIATHARPLPPASSSTPTSREEDLSNGAPTMTHSDIAFRVLAEVLSLYPTRGTAGDGGPGGLKPEVLISAGCLALGREPCKSYSGWGVVAPDPWHSSTSTSKPQITFDATTLTPGHHHDNTLGTVIDADALSKDPRRTGWVVDRLSQEHGIMTWEGDAGLMAQRPLTVGQKVLIWPNHACIAGAGFGWYVVVDSERDVGEAEGEARGCRIVDVWVRCHGW